MEQHIAQYLGIPVPEHNFNPKSMFWPNAPPIDDNMTGSHYDLSGAPTEMPVDLLHHPIRYMNLKIDSDLHVNQPVAGIGWEDPDKPYNTSQEIHKAIIGGPNALMNRGTSTSSPIGPMEWYVEFPNKTHEVQATDPVKGDVIVTVNGAPVATTKEFWSSILNQKEQMWDTFTKYAQKNHRDLIRADEKITWDREHPKPMNPDRNSHLEPEPVVVPKYFIVKLGYQTPIADHNAALKKYTQYTKFPVDPYYERHRIQYLPLPVKVEGVPEAERVNVTAQFQGQPRTLHKFKFKNKL